MFHVERGLCMEREWSADGETEISRVPYTRIRFTPVYDAVAIFALPKIPADLTPYYVGTTVEVW